jgi:type I restriction enzyme, S subunit
VIETRVNTFSELIDAGFLAIGDGYRAKLEELGGDGPIFLRAGQLTRQGITWEGTERFYRTLASQLSSKLGHAGDTVMTTKGNSTGRSAYVPNEAPCFVYSPHLSYWRSMDPCQLSPLYLRYWAQSPEFIDQLRAMAGSTDMAPYLSLGDQKRLRITIPDIDTQRAIGAVLGALDDKIAVNDRIASVTDSLAAALLNDLLEHDDGIERVALAEVARINARKVSPRLGERLRYIDITSVTRGSIEWPQPISWDDAPSRARRGVESGDTIWSTVRPGRRSFALLLENDPMLVVSTGFAVLTPMKVGPAFLYEVSKRDEFVQYLESVAEGSAYPAVQAKRFEHAVIPLPSQSLLRRFEETAIAMRERAYAAGVESRALAQLRNTVLLGLMSGEIRVREAEKLAEEVT